MCLLVIHDDNLNYLSVSCIEHEVQCVNYFISPVCVWECCSLLGGQTVVLNF